MANVTFCFHVWHIFCHHLGLLFELIVQRITDHLACSSSFSSSYSLFQPSQFRRIHFYAISRQILSKMDFIKHVLSRVCLSLSLSVYEIAFCKMFVANVYECGPHKWWWSNFLHNKLFSRSFNSSFNKIPQLWKVSILQFQCNL